MQVLDSEIARKQDSVECSDGTGLISENAPAEPFVSVLIPTYNQADFLPETIDSLLAQTYKNWEAVVVNDGSTDHTRDLLNRYDSIDQRVKAFHKTNGGTASALNMALKHARGQWICWLSSDDLFESDALETFTRAIEEHPDYKFFHSDFYELKEETGEKKAILIDRNEKMHHPICQVLAFFVSNYIHGISIAVNKQILEKAGGFSEDLKFAQDVDMWLRISALTPSFFIDKRICVSRVSSASGTTAFPEAGRIEVARSCMNFLNRNPFPACFPRLDFDNPEEVMLAVQATFRVVTNLKAHHYIGVGYTPALMDRMCEWLSNDCQPEIKEMVLQKIEPVIDAVTSASLPPEIKSAFSNLRMMRHFKMSYQPYDPLNQMIRHASQLIDQNKAVQAEPILRYLHRQFDV